MARWLLAAAWGTSCEPAAVTLVTTPRELRNRAGRSEFVPRLLKGHR
jgi:hypothetical protein